MKLRNRVAIVTGGARGIGKATAELFCKEGGSVFIWDMLQEGEETAKSIRNQGGDCQFQSIDVRDYNALKTAVDQIIQSHGKIDVLINNAGVTRDKTLLKMSHEEWQNVIDINLTGVFNCTKAVVTHMVEKGFGRIINTSSIVGIHGNYGQTNYTATKSGVIGMTRTWSKELTGKGITCNAVAPGFIKTEMTDLIPEEVSKQILQTIPAGKMGSPKDIANAYLFLASEEAGYISGQVLGVNGGQAI